MKRQFWAVLTMTFAVACGAMDAPGGNGNNGGSGATGGGAAGGTGGGGGTGGSGGGVSVAPDWVSGSRLRARVMTTPDGAKSQYGWYDTQLNVVCYVQPSGDGQQRCMPQTYATIGGYYFSDGGCSTKLASIPTQFATTCPPTIASFAEATATCNEYGIPASRIHHFTLGSVYAGTIYTGTPANCTMTTASGQTMYQVGAEVAPSTYVLATITTE